MEKDKRITFQEINLTQIGQEYNVSYMSQSGRMENHPTVTGSFQTIKFADFDLRDSWFLSNTSPTDIIESITKNISLSLTSEDPVIRKLAEDLYRWKIEK